MIAKMEMIEKTTGFYQYPDKEMGNLVRDTNSIYFLGGSVRNFFHV